MSFQETKLSETEQMAFPSQRGTVPLFQNRPKPERKKGKDRLPNHYRFQGLY